MSNATLSTYNPVMAKPSSVTQGIFDASFFDEHQQFAIHRVMSRVLNYSEINKSSIVKLDAPGGFGKTHMLRFVCDILEAIDVKFAVATFTGRAASQVSKEGIGSVSTLHSLLLTPVVDGDGNLLYFADKNPNEVAASIGRVLFCDEASMIPSDMFKTMQGICDNYGILFVILGDQAQLPSIEPKEVGEFDLLRRTDIDFESLILQTNYRQKEGSAIADLCMHLRQINSIPRKKADDLLMIRKSKVLTLEFHEENQFDVMICGTHNIRRRLNGLARRARGYDEEFAQNGEIVICKRNDVVSNQKINNGELYKVVQSFPSSRQDCRTYLLSCLDKDLKIRVNIPNSSWEGDTTFGRKLGGLPVQLFDFGYAITTHSAQGSQFDNLLVFDEDVSYFVDQQRWRYTAMSRARLKLTVAM